ncbi:MAG TPA: hypothetical protein VE267_03735, partial [Bradyrhizobium sp.]|nr:hypothetical protein [Bradyrhizobium sp.]
REWHGLSERRNAQPRRQQTGERTQTVDSRIISRRFSKRFSGHRLFSTDCYHAILRMPTGDTQL